MTKLVSDDVEVQRAIKAWRGPVKMFDRLTTNYRAYTAPMLRRLDRVGGIEDISVETFIERSRQLASVLISLGVDKGDSVGTILSDTSEFVVALLAVLRLGAVLVPIQSSFQRNSVRFRLIHCNATVVICDQRSARNAVGLNVEVLIVGTDKQSLGDDLAPQTHHISQFDSGGIEISRTYGADDPMIAMYTSGTTGDPKAVMWTPSSFAAFSVYQRLGLDLKADDVFVSLADPSWSYGLGNGVLAALLCGTPYHALPPAPSTELVLDLLAKLGVSVLGATPSHLRALVGHLPDDLVLPSLRRICSAGEVLDPELARVVQERLGVVVRDGYGLSEVGMPIVNLAPQSHKGDPIPLCTGQALPGFEVAILGDDEQPLPPNTLGQIALRCDSPLYWFHGYFEDDIRSKENLSSDGSYLLTGDLGYYNNAEEYVVTGRSDEVIVRSEYQIGPTEVEQALLSCSGISDAGVVGVKGIDGRQRVWGFVVAAHTVSASEKIESIGLEIAANYAPFLRPDEIRIVTELPRTSSGKLQRYVLREWATNS